MWTPRVASADTFDTQPAPFQEAMNLKRFDGVLGTSRDEATGIRCPEEYFKRGQKKLVNPDQ
jgi:hypothetical protein